MWSYVLSQKILGRRNTQHASDCSDTRLPSGNQPSRVVTVMGGLLVRIVNSRSWSKSASGDNYAVVSKVVELAHCYL